MVGQRIGLAFLLTIAISLYGSVYKAHDGEAVTLKTNVQISQCLAADGLNRFNLRDSG